MSIAASIIDPAHPPVRFLNREKAINQMNEWGGRGIPFFFLISYDTQRTILLKNPIPQVRPSVYFSFPNIRHNSSIEHTVRSANLTITPPDKSIYERQFNQIKEELQKGNIYLLNLTRSSPIQTDLDLHRIFAMARAKYKVFLPGKFVVFSPETFVRIQQGRIFTFPMKGTMRVDIPEARNILQHSAKEQAEHASVVDLLRNDLGRISTNVKVNRYRYFEKVKAGPYELWQVSSELEGKLPPHFEKSLGSLIFQLLPAGSITGVPKRKAVEIIERVEDYDRGFYTGVCGYFDGQNLDSGVMIRFVEQTPDGLVYKSGGGIHQMSDLDMEFEELINKIYVPVD